MRRFELRLGGNLTQGVIESGHLTSGMVALYNAIFRIYSCFETAVIPDPVSGACLLHKSSIGDAGSVVPDLIDIGARMTVLSKTSTACVPSCANSDGAALAVYGAADACVIPDVSADMVLNCAVEGGSAVEVCVESTFTDLLHILGDVECPVVADLSATVESKKQLEGLAETEIEAESALSADKDLAISGGVEVLSSAKSTLLRMRKLSEFDGMDMSDMDDETLYELDYIEL